MKKIKVTINSDGEIVLDAEGYAGCGCTDATKAIETALASGKRTSRTLKPEYYLTEEVSETEQDSLTVRW